MIKCMGVGMAVTACLVTAIAADAADLSMVPIYQTRPSVVAAPAGNAKDQSRPSDVPDPRRFKLSPETSAMTPSGAPLIGHVFWTGVYDRF